VLGDEPEFAHPGLEHGSAHDGGHHLGEADHLVDLGALLGASEVAAHPVADVHRGADVEHLAARVLEQIHARLVGQAVGQVPLAPARRRHRVGGRGEVLEVRDAERCEATEQSVQHVDRGARVGQGTVRRARRRVEEGGERRELVVGNLVAGHRPPGQRDGVEHLGPRPGVVERARRGLEEPDVERSVVRHQDRPVRELQETRQDLLDRRCPGDHRGGDPGQSGDEGGDRRARVDQRLELAQDRTAAHLDRADLGDRGTVRRPAGGLEVDDDERHLGQGCAEFVESELDRCTVRGR